jgi:hypothetical protein
MLVALIVLIVIMSLASLAVLVMAVIEFILGMRQAKEDKANAMAETANSAPAKEKPAYVSEDPYRAVEDYDSSREDTNDYFDANESQRLTLEEAYNALGRKDKNYFDRVVDAANELPYARITESTYACTVMQGRDSIARLRIIRGVVVLDCTVVNPELVKYNRENGKKIRNKPVRFRILDEDEFDAAIYTLAVANEAALETRNKRPESSAHEPEVPVAEDISNRFSFDDEAPSAEENFIVSADELVIDDMLGDTESQEAFVGAETSALEAQIDAPLVDVAVEVSEDNATPAEEVVSEKAPSDETEAADNAAEAAEEEPTPAVEEEKKASELEGPIVVELDELVIDEGENV